MTHVFSGRVAAALVFSVLALAPVAGQAATTRPGRAPRVQAGTPAVHRVVWDQYQRGRKGIHLRSVTADGHHLRRVYDAPRGFTMALTLDRAGRRVAFAPCCRTSFPTLVVVPVRGGKALEPLAGHREIDFVGGIGWSPDGTRLVFEGSSGSGEQRTHSLWSVRPDGTGLTHILTQPKVEQPVINDALAWTPAGILYSDGTNLRSAWAGRSHVVMRHVTSVRISGDGRRILTHRFLHGRSAYWYSRPDGSHQRRILSDDADSGVVFRNLVPSHDGSRVLAFRTLFMAELGDRSDVVTWRAAGAGGAARVLDVVDGSYVVTWN